MKVSGDDDIPTIWKNKSHVPVTTSQLLVYQPHEYYRYITINHIMVVINQLKAICTQHGFLLIFP